MAKCLIDIKKDIIDKAAEKLVYRGAVVSGNVGYFPAPNKASKAIAEVNDEFREAFVKESEKGSFFIDPSDSLVDKYFEEFKKRDDLRSLQYFNKDQALFEQEQREYLQITGSSKSSKEILKKIKEAAIKMGIDIQSLTEYAKNNPAIDQKTVNGVADLVRGIIALAEGKEDEALTEEVVHIATAILEQVNPGLVSEMISRINNFSIYKQVYEKYKDNKHYQLPNGKPDIRKIKKEAVDKLIAEIIVNGGTNLSRFPELANPVQKSFWAGMWDKIVEYFSRLLKKSDISIYKQAAAQIVAGEVGGTVENIKQKGVFFQLSNSQKTIQESLQETKDTINKVYKPEDVEIVLTDAEEANNWYERTLPDGSAKRVGNRVTDRVKRWYKQRFGGKVFSEKEKKLNNLKREYGIAGHADFEQIVKRYYDADGTKKAVPDAKPVGVNLPSLEMYEKLETYFLEVIKDIEQKSGGPVAVFTEVVIYDEKRDEAGTIDLLVIEQDGTANILDWKFMQVFGDDIPWFKQGAYNEQLAAYASILKDNYGITKFRYKRAIPILMGFEKEDKYDPESELYLSGIGIGTTNPDRLTDMRLVPISEKTESTGVDLLDKLVSQLNSLLKSVSDEDYLSDEDREDKLERMNIIRQTIRRLQGMQDINSVVELISTLRGRGQDIINKYTAVKDLPVDSPDITNEQLSDLSYDMRDFIAVAEAFSNIDDELDSIIYDKSMEALAKTESEKEEFEFRKKLAQRLVFEAKEVRLTKNKIETLSKEFTRKYIGLRNAVQNLDSPEVVIKGLGATFRTNKELEGKAITVMTRLVEEAQVGAQQEALEIIKELMAIREEIASKHGNIAEYTNKIFKKGDNNEFVNQLISQFQQEFYNTVDEKALKGGDRTWLLANIDTVAYMKEAKEYLEQKIARINTSPNYKIQPDYTKEVVEQKLREKEAAIENLKRLYDLSRKDFNGWNNFIIKRHPLNKWYTQEYKDLVDKPENTEALKLYNFIRNFNKEAKEVGYISAAVEKIFLPWVRKDFAESFKLSGLADSVGNFFQKLQASVDDVGYGKINELTQQFENALPKYFTYDFTKKEVGGKEEQDFSQVSQEVFKNLILYVQQVKKYKYLSGIEDQLLLLKTVETFKGHIVTTRTGEVVMENGVPKVENRNNEINAKMYDDFMKAIFYGQKYVLSDADTPLYLDKVIGGIKKVINKAIGKEYFKEDDKPTYTSMVKTMDALNRATQMRQLGLEPASGIINFLGLQLQLKAQLGAYCTFDEVRKKEFTIWNHLFGNQGDETLISLIETFMPMSEDPAYEMFKEAGLTALTRRSFSDDLMVWMRKPEQLAEKSVFLALLDNMMIENGKIVSIPEFVKAKYTERYKPDVAAEIKKEVDELKQTRAISKIAKMEDGKLVIPGLDLNNKKELSRLTVLSRDIIARASAKLTPASTSRMQMNIWTKSMMVFKNWIPVLADTRFSELKKVSNSFSTAVDENGIVTGEKYDIGRIRLYLYVLSTSITERTSNIINILRANEEGVKKLDELYIQYAKDYEARTGQKLNMSKDDFIEMVRANLLATTKELRLLLGIMSILFASGYVAPDDDADKATKNRFRYLQRILDKYGDEIGFFYKPSSISSILSGGMPAVSVFKDISKTVSHVTMEITGFDVSDPSKSFEEVRKNAHPVKYGMKLFPGAKASLTYLSIFSEDFAKEFDVTIQKESSNR